MKMHLWGTDFRRGSAEIRRHLYFTPEERESRLRNILVLGFQDIVYLSTCNRIEFYTTAPSHFVDMRPAWLRLLESLGLSEDAYYQGYHFEGKSALRHLVRVASSLESLVVGEPQILGQLKDAHRSVVQAGLPMQATLNRSFQFAFETAKRVRTETRLGEKPTSIATLGLDHLQSHEREYPLRRVAVVGRSPINLIVIQWLRKHRKEVPIVWVNRSLSNLKKYPEADGLQLQSLESFLSEPEEFSHLFTATSSRDPLFDSDFFRRVCSCRQLVFDFAEPPDVGPLDDLVGGPHVIRLCDLRNEAQANSAARRHSIGEAERIVEGALRSYFLNQKEAPLLREFNSVEKQFWDTLQVALGSLGGDLTPQAEQRVRKWAEALVKKNLHHSRHHLRTVLRSVTETPDSETQVKVL